MDIIYAVRKSGKASHVPHPHVLSNAIQYLLFSANSSLGKRVRRYDKEQEWLSYSRSYMSPRNCKCMSHICGFFRDPPSLGRISTEVPWMQDIQLTAYHFQEVHTLLWVTSFIQMILLDRLSLKN